MRGLIAASWPGVVLDFAHSSSLEDRLFHLISSITEKTHTGQKLAGFSGTCRYLWMAFILLFSIFSLSP